MHQRANRGAKPVVKAAPVASVCERSAHQSMSGARLLASPRVALEKLNHKRNRHGDAWRENKLGKHQSIATYGEKATVWLEKIAWHLTGVAKWRCIAGAGRRAWRGEACAYRKRVGRISTRSSVSVVRVAAKIPRGIDERSAYRPKP